MTPSTYRSTPRPCRSINASNASRLPFCAASIHTSSGLAAFAIVIGKKGVWKETFEEKRFFLNLKDSTPRRLGPGDNSIPCDYTPAQGSFAGFYRVGGDRPLVLHLIFDKGD